MGLAVSVGITSEPADADEEEAAERRDELDRLSAALAAEGVHWGEPEGAPVPPMRSAVISFPYSCLHHLRRVLALVDAGRPVPPVDGPAALDQDKNVVKAKTMTFSSHLLCHSDCEGYYVPVDFPEPLFLPEDEVAGGGMVGSSQGLLAELRRCAPALGVRLEPDGSLSDGEAARLSELPEDADFATETMVWLTLHEACLASIVSGYAIVFE